jgi:hypothetical protein
MRLRAWFILVLILVASPAAWYARAGDAPGPTEYQLKAAYIYHFAQFVDWPSTAFAKPDSPLVIGILGDNPFGGDLTRTVAGKVLNKHPLVVQEYHAVGDLTNACQVLFISSSEKRNLPEIFASLKDASTLTVGDVPHFTENGGMINFILEGDKIRFQINETNVKKARLNMSFKLLSLASEVTH